MTEIEKSMLGMKEKIDLNGQANEISILLDSLERSILNNSRNEDNQENAKNIITLAVYIMEAINDYVYKLHPNTCIMPIIIAGVASWVELIRGTLDEKEKETTDLLIEAVVNSYIVRKEVIGEDDEEGD